MNLLDELPKELDLREFRLLLDERVGGPGHAMEAPEGKLYLPLARAACRIVLVYEGSRIVSVEQGPAFDPDEWATIVGEVATSIVRGPIKVGREYSFALFSRDPSRVARTAFSGADPFPLQPTRRVQQSKWPNIPSFLNSRFRLATSGRLLTTDGFASTGRLSLLLKCALLAGRISVPPPAARNTSGQASAKGRVRPSSARSRAGTHRGLSGCRNSSLRS